MSDDRVPPVADTPERPLYATTVVVDLATVTSADVQELLWVVLTREAKELQERCERLDRAAELLSHPTIGAYRRHIPEVQTPGIDL